MTTETSTATTISRTFKGVEYLITDNGDGTFTWNGARFSSATAVVTVIRAEHGLKSAVNGRKWLGLSPGTGTGKRSAAARLGRARAKIGRLSTELAALVVEVQTLASEVEAGAQAAVEKAEAEAKKAAEAAKAKVAGAKARKAAAKKAVKEVKAEVASTTKVIETATEATRSAP